MAYTSCSGSFVSSGNTSILSINNGGKDNNAGRYSFWFAKTSETVGDAGYFSYGLDINASSSLPNIPHTHTYGYSLRCLAI